jgi:DNA (cytosine-5)-methyltransferase 1
VNFLSLFSGIGGLDLGLERAGMRCVAQVEIDPFCRKVLAKHWPDVRRFADVKDVTRESLSGLDFAAMAGGFPCQDVSQAGRRVGITGPRSGLWSEFFRLICDLRPQIVLVENTAGLLERGLGRVLADLASIRFDAEWSVVPACAMGTPHSRPRVFLVAHPAGGWAGQLRWEPREGESEADWNIHWAEGEPGIPRVADGVPNRVDRLRGLGNAVVPQVAEWIGRRIMEAEGRAVA